MKAFPLRACGMAVGAAVLLGGCSSLPLGDVPIVDRSVPTSGEHTTAGSQSSSFAPLGDVRDSGRTHTVTAISSYNRNLTRNIGLKQVLGITRFCISCCM